LDAKTIEPRCVSIIGEISTKYTGAMALLPFAALLKMAIYLFFARQKVAEPGVGVKGNNF
jgi:hypothetical protein